MSAAYTLRPSVLVGLRQPAEDGGVRPATVTAVLAALLCTSLLAAAPPGAAAAAGSADGKGFIPRQSEAPAGQKRVALIIGNGAYTKGPLRNPTRDAKAMAEALSSIGFDVDARFDLDRAGMLRALRRFAERLDKDSVALFYYSGHGITHDGRSFMLPVATDIRTAADVEIEGVDLRRVTARLEEVGSRLNLVILDACRNNPQIFAGQRGSRGGGLAFTTAPTGTLIAYATAPGQTAADGRGRLSPYTKALVQELRVPGRPVEEVFKAVRRRVRRASQGTQVPWESSSLEGRFVFVPEGWTPTPIAPDENDALAAAVDRADRQAEATAPEQAPPKQRRRVIGVAAAEQAKEDAAEARRSKLAKKRNKKKKTARQSLTTVKWQRAKADALRTEIGGLEGELDVWRVATGVTGFGSVSAMVIGGATFVIMLFASAAIGAAATTLGLGALGLCCAGAVGLGVTAALGAYTVNRMGELSAKEEQLRSLVTAESTKTRAMAY